MNAPHREFKLPDDLHLAYDASGPEDGPPVLLLHGFGQTRRAWAKTTRALAQHGYRCYAVDLRGHGASAWSSKGEYDLEHYVRDIRAMLAQAREPLTLVGASLGGIASLIACGEEPRMPVRCVVLVDITSRVSAEGVDRIHKFMSANMAGFASVEEAADSVSAYLPDRQRPKDLTGLKNNLRQGDDGRYYWHWDPAALDMAGWSDQESIDQRIERAARNVDAPVLILRGGRSELVSPEAARQFLKLLKHGELIDIDDAHHMVAGDKNDAFTEALVEFVARHGK